VDATEIDHLLARLNGSGSDAEWEAVYQLRQLEGFPVLLLGKYKVSRKWGERASCVFHALRYAKEDRAAFQLGLLALKDKSKVVRYRATMLLAVSQNPDALTPLRELLESGQSAEDASAAIDAITGKDPNRFVDRNHSGKIVMKVQ
jgi:hypothetical protein